MRSSTLVALTGLLTLAAATPVSPPLPHALPQVQPIEARESEDNATAPCARVSQAMYPDKSSVPNNLIPAKLAYDCITSVPFNATAGKRLLQAIDPYIQWQTTINVLKNPPAEYVEKVQPPVDIYAVLKRIEADIDAGKYTNEYAFGFDLYSAIQSAHDGHFTYIPDSVGTVFAWGRPVPLVSVSEDGEKLPAVFAFYDVLGLQFKNISYTPSPVVEIDGQEATQWLENWSQFGSLQDRDALYNNVFYNLAQISLGSGGSVTGTFTGGGRGRWVFPGATTTLKFANGTTYTMENYARVQTNFRGIDSGEKLAERYFYFASSTGTQYPQAEQAQTSSLAAAAAGTPPGYPTPIIPGPLNLINGFYVDAPGYEDVAVLQLPNFVGGGPSNIPFQKVTQEFFPQAVAAGKTKLIIDVQANGGGTILQGYDLFKQLFPSIDPYGANRFRASVPAALIGEVFSRLASETPRSITANQSVQQFQASYFDYHTDMTVDGKPFTSWQDKFGPVEINGDQYTKLSRWNLTDVYTNYNSGGINITGYGPLANASAVQPFKAENIVLLTDGYCASTCSIFSEFLTKQAGVKTIALGGRSNKKAIQAIGGVKGTNTYQYAYIQSVAQISYRSAPDDLRERNNHSALRKFDDETVFQRAAGAPSLNVRDGLKYNDNSGTALQFIYEEADCRLFYTPEMTIDATAMWKAAADAQWGKNGKCVKAPTYGKRKADELTTSLKRRRVQVASADALRQFGVFESTFRLETDNRRLQGDGFMQP